VSTATAKPVRAPDVKTFRAYRSSRRVYSRKQRWIIGVLNLSTFFVVWQLVAVYSDIPQLFLPSVTDVFRELKEMSDEGILWGNLAISTWIYVIGMVISIAIAVPLGLLIGGVRILDRIFSTYVWAL
jgi:ABC-type nitrate/sulfonate/bicarbonate transport system permease component